MIGRDVLSLITGDPLSPAIRKFKLGELREAQAMLQEHAGRYGLTTTCEFYLGLIERRLANNGPAPAPVLIWRDDTDRAGAAGWVRFLLNGIVTEEIAGEPDRMQRRMIVVDRALTPEKQAWYRRAHLAGSDVTLLHLGDAHYAEDCGAYRWCRQVLRCYWSPLMRNAADVHFLPLGPSDAFGHPVGAKPVHARLHLWGFAGDPDRPTRSDMLAAMRTIGQGALHLTAERAPLTQGAYRALLDECAIAPCPAGAEALDTTRLCEALEAGCIPIVERREGFDYFRQAFGAHPIPTLSDWAEAPELIRALQAGDRLETKRAQCHAWWRHYKGHLAARIAGLMRAG